ncbi:MAG: single-stranded-DNA-specific exonuclease RecJ [Candidatus Marinimicrobia bacterium]|nr:single-stranded-DNA-specific exonuclease RecJ [Candidatus Neomarinimicrobiota bacterium]
MNYKWNIKETDSKKVEEISRKYNLSRLISKILVNKGVEDIEQFLNPTLDKLHDPFLMKDMDRAVDRIQTAIEKKEKILVFGDYDVDGTTSTALLILVLQEMGLNPDFYIPNRENEGYGLSVTGINLAIEKKTKLILTCDCGINALDEVEYARANGIDVVITDHHEPMEVLPNALAIVDPKRKDCPYPFKELCGAGVAFKVLQALITRFSWFHVEKLYKHLDLVAIGTAADIVPLINENRILTSEGLKRMATTRKLGIQSLLKVSNFSENQIIRVSNIVFGAAPRINAAGRLDEASQAVKLLISESPNEAGMIAQNLDKINLERRNIERKTVDAAIMELKYSHDLEKDKIIILHKRGWHQGVIGIVASKLKETYNRPVIMISIDNGIGRGSGRSIQDFDLHNALQECSEYLENYGGHIMAAGLTIKEENIGPFIQKMKEVANRKITDEMLLPVLDIDSEITFLDINHENIHYLNKMAPFGPANMRPKLVARNVTISGIPKIIGEKHLKFRVCQNKIVISAIGWKLGEFYEMLISNRPLDIAFVIEENEYRGLREIQLNIKDIKYSN